jgi:hypothetical protein
MALSSGAKVVRKQTHESTQAAPIPIVTSGEIFADGAAIERARQIGEPERASLLYLVVHIRIDYCSGNQKLPEFLAPSDRNFSDSHGSRRSSGRNKT